MKPIQKIIKEEKGIFQIRIDRENYIIDEYFYRRIKKLKNSIANMTQTIRKYTERIEIKEKYIKEISGDIKNRFKKELKK